MYLNGAVDWSAKQVKIVPDSSCEAETAVASKAAKATCFVRGLLRFHCRPVAAETPMIGDNQAMHTLVTNEGATSRTRYYERATLLTLSLHSGHSDRWCEYLETLTWKNRIPRWKISS